MCVGTAPAGLAVEVKRSAHIARVRRQVFNLCTPFSVVVKSAGGGGHGGGSGESAMESSAADDCDSDDEMRRQFIETYATLSRFVPSNLCFRPARTR
jgi:hypothetical protein